MQTDSDETDDAVPSTSSEEPDPKPKNKIKKFVQVYARDRDEIPNMLTDVRKEIASWTSNFTESLNTNSLGMNVQNVKNILREKAN